ncbi:hypothetical protein HY417_04185 [Candidatus Kaiserbacteria bacterium]|nr:hypothetical protein [Candidatus Kaiserbacteria bacterium]
MEKNKRIQSKRRAPKLGRVQREILAELSGGDLLVGFLLSGRSTKRMFRIARERAMYRHRRKRVIEGLAELEYLRMQGERLSITEKGKSILGDVVETTRKTLKIRAWDGKWRVVIFDIPEVYASLRDRVRGILKRAGFEQLQQSVWIFPHECEELVRFIREEPRLSRYVLYGVLDRIQGDERLKRLFKV